jgi:hypothetical protein
MKECKEKSREGKNMKEGDKRQEETKNIAHAFSCILDGSQPLRGLTVFFLKLLTMQFRLVKQSPYITEM